MPVYPNNVSGIQSQLTRERLPVGWPWRFFTVMLIIFLAVVLSYLGLEFGYKPFLNRQLNTLENQANDYQNSIVSAGSQNYINLYSQIINIESLLKTHVNPTAFLSLLASLTDPHVSYSSLNVNAARNEINIGGTAASYAVLASQLQIYENSPEITRVILQSSASNGSSVTFEVSLLVKPDIFAYSQASSTTTPSAPAQGAATTTATTTKP